MAHVTRGAVQKLRPPSIHYCGERGLTLIPAPLCVYSLDALWATELKDDLTCSRWYGVAAEYWKKQTPDDDGVLGGYGYISGTDILSSEEFLFSVLGKMPRASSVALDCGAGVGRVTEGCLLPLCATVDVLEPDQTYIKVAEERLADRNKGQYIQQGLQEYVPAKGRYNIIWMQWVALYLTDNDMITCLRNHQAALKEGGAIFFKENVVTTSGFVVDKEDNSITRCDRNYKDLFRRAGLTLIAEKRQEDFPEELFDVKMYAVR